MTKEDQFEPEGEKERVNFEGRGAEDRRGTLTPVWDRLHEHEHKLSDLPRDQGAAHQRIKGTEQVVQNVHQELKDWKNQTHADSNRIIDQLQAANKQGKAAAEKAYETATVIRTLKWVVPTSIAGTGAIFGVLTFLVKAGVLG